MGWRLGTLRTDRGGEFMARAFVEHCAEHGVQRHLTAPYTPQQNGVVERRNQTVLGMARSMMKSQEGARLVVGGGGAHSRVHPEPVTDEERRRENVVSSMVWVQTPCSLLSHFWLCGTRQGAWKESAEAG